MFDYYYTVLCGAVVLDGFVRACDGMADALGHAEFVLDTYRERFASAVYVVRVCDGVPRGCRYRVERFG